MVTRKKAESIPAVLNSYYETPEGTMKCETANGIIEFSIPTGELGLLHFDLLVKAYPKDFAETPVINKETGEQMVDEETNEPLFEYKSSPKDDENWKEARREWISKILPSVAISPAYDKMRGEDQSICFVMAMDSIRVNSEEMFRPCK